MSFFLIVLTLTVTAVVCVVFGFLVSRMRHMQEQLDGCAHDVKLLSDELIRRRIDGLAAANPPVLSDDK